jgi:hypothetical protein
MPASRIATDAISNYEFRGSFASGRPFVVADRRSAIYLSLINAAANKGAVFTDISRDLIVAGL